MGLFDWMRSDPRARIERDLRRKSAQAVAHQRNGKLREFAALTAEVAALEKQLDELERRPR